MFVQSLSSALKMMQAAPMQQRSFANKANDIEADMFTRSNATAQATPRFGMLVLSRKKNESIVINNDVIVTVVEIRGDKVRLGIVAPKEVPVHRQEVFEAIHGKPGADPGPSTVVPKPVD